MPETVLQCCVLSAAGCDSGTAVIGDTKTTFLSQGTAIQVKNPAEAVKIACRVSM